MPPSATPEMLLRLRALRRDYAKKMRAHAALIRKASAALVKAEKELKQAKYALCETEEERELYSVTFQPYGDIAQQAELTGDVTCPGFNDIRDTMKHVIEECDRILGGDDRLPSEMWDY